MGQFESEAVCLKGDILAAFSAVPRPEEVADCLDPIEAERCRRLLGGKRVEDWKDRPLEALADGTHMTQLSFISAAAYQYYLPLYMLAAALHCEDADVLPEELISSFSRTEDPKLNKRFFDDRFRGFTDAQLRAILAFLGFMRKHHYQAEHLGYARKSVDYAVESIKSLLGTQKA